jgi:hypothetical protein
MVLIKVYIKMVGFEIIFFPLIFGTFLLPCKKTLQLKLDKTDILIFPEWSVSRMKAKIIKRSEIDSKILIKIKYFQCLRKRLKRNNEIIHCL